MRATKLLITLTGVNPTLARHIHHWRQDGQLHFSTGNTSYYPAFMKPAFQLMFNLKSLIVIGPLCPTCIGQYLPEVCAFQLDTFVCDYHDDARWRLWSIHNTIPLFPAQSQITLSPQLPA